MMKRCPYIELFKTSNLLGERTRKTLFIYNKETVSEWRPIISCDFSCL